MAARNKLHKWKEKLERNWIIELLSKVIWAFMNKQNNSGIWCQPANWSAHIEEPLSCVRVLSDRCTHHHQHHHHRPSRQYVDCVNGAIVKWKAINFSLLCIYTRSSSSGGSGIGLCSKTWKLNWFSILSLRKFHCHERDEVNVTVVGTFSVSPSLSVCVYVSLKAKVKRTKKEEGWKSSQRHGSVVAQHFCAMQTIWNLTTHTFTHENWMAFKCILGWLLSLVQVDICVNGSGGAIYRHPPHCHNANVINVKLFIIFTTSPLLFSLPLSQSLFGFLSFHCFLWSFLLVCGTIAHTLSVKKNMNKHNKGASDGDAEWIWRAGDEKQRCKFHRMNGMKQSYQHSIYQYHVHVEWI